MATKKVETVCSCSAQVTCLLSSKLVIGAANRKARTKIMTREKLHLIEERKLQELIRTKQVQAFTCQGVSLSEHFAKGY
jgi:hypothetical protein